MIRAQWISILGQEICWFPIPLGGELLFARCLKCKPPSTRFIATDSYLLWLAFIFYNPHKKKMHIWNSFFPSSILVAHASLFVQNISVTICSIVLMLVFSYKQRIEQIWDGWLTVSRHYILATTQSLCFGYIYLIWVLHREVIAVVVPSVSCPCCLCLWACGYSVLS